MLQYHVDPFNFPHKSRIRSFRTRYLAYYHSGMSGDAVSVRSRDGFETSHGRPGYRQSTATSIDYTFPASWLQISVHQHRKNGEKTYPFTGYNLFCARVHNVYRQATNAGKWQNFAAGIGTGSGVSYASKPGCCPT